MARKYSNPMTNPLHYATEQLRTGPPTSYVTAQRKLQGYDFGMSHNTRRNSGSPRVLIRCAVQQSLSAPALQAPCWRPSCPRMLTLACCCWRQAARTLRYWRRACPYSSRSSSTRNTTGTTQQLSSQGWPTGACTGRAASCWAGRRQSMP